MSGTDAVGAEHAGLDAARAAMRRAIGWGAVAAAVITVVLGVVGTIVAGGDGLLSAIFGAGTAFLFLGITALALMLAGRMPRETSQVALMGALLGGWFVKVLLFVGIMLAIRGQPWIVGPIVLVGIVATVLASLVIDSVVVARARIPIDVPSH